MTNNSIGVNGTYGISREQAKLVILLFIDLLQASLLTIHYNIAVIISDVK